MISGGIGVFTQLINLKLQYLGFMREERRENWGEYLRSLCFSGSVIFVKQGCTQARENIGTIEPPFWP